MTKRQILVGLGAIALPVLLYTYAMSLSFGGKTPEEYHRASVEERQAYEQMCEADPGSIYC